MASTATATASEVAAAHLRRSSCRVSAALLPRLAPLPLRVHPTRVGEGATGSRTPGSFQVRRPVAWASCLLAGTCLRSRRGRSPWRRPAAEFRAPRLATKGLLPESFRFRADDPAFFPWLEERGVAVLVGAVPAAEVAEIQELVWEWLEGLGVDRSDPASWKVEGGRWPRDNRSEGGGTGIVATHGSGQSEAAWRVRVTPAVRRAFELIWGTDDLLTSMDPLILWRPWQHKPASVTEEWRTRSAWLHMDQNIVRTPGRCLVQGLVALTVADNATTGGFVCVPGGHRPTVQQRLRERYLLEGVHGDRRSARRRGDFFPIPEGDPAHSEVVLVPLQPGDLVLWDSRVPHGSEPAAGTADTAARPAGAALLRMAVPVCMAPRTFAAAPEVLHEWRRDAVRRGVTTKHWPHKMRTQGEPAGPGFVPPRLTDEMLRLL